MSTATKRKACTCAATEPLLEITFPQPAEWLNSNDRRHHMAQARLVKYWRDVAHLLARRAMRGRDPFERVKIVATFHRADRRSYDPPNLWPTLKACVDGFQDAGVIAQDSWPTVVAQDCRRGEPGPRRFVIRVYEAGDDDD